MQLHHFRPSTIRPTFMETIMFMFQRNSSDEKEYIALIRTWLSRTAFCRLFLTFYQMKVPFVRIYILLYIDLNSKLWLIWRFMVRKWQVLEPDLSMPPLQASTCVRTQLPHCIFNVSPNILLFFYAKRQHSKHKCRQYVYRSLWGI